MQMIDNYVILVGMNPYDYTSSTSIFNLHLKKSNKSWRHYAVDFPAAFHTRHKEYHTARGEYFEPTGTDAVPMLIMLHGVGDHSILPCRLLARNLARQSIASLILYLPVHSSRIPPMVRKVMPHLTADEWFEIYRTSVIEVRQVVDWAITRPELDTERLAVFGISFGGFVSEIAMGIDERINAGIFFVSGGNSGMIAQKSRWGFLRRNYRSSETEYHKRQDIYTEYLDEVAEKGFEDVALPSRDFLIDPLTYAYKLQQRSVLMINATCDVFIPREATEDFWQRCGRPEIVWLTGGHTSIWLWYPLIRRRISTFLLSVFGG